MKELSLFEIAKAVGAKTDINASVSDICTDTRTLKEGCLFVALEGENYDGHIFAGDAVDLGAVAVLCHKKTNCQKEIMVRDTRRALLDLSAYYRGLFEIPVVGITGSVGKTTVKEMTFAVLSRKFKTLKNEGNLNNEIGLPETIFNLDESYEAAVLEMGMSSLGEISRLSKAAKPCVGIIGNIGVSHLENLGTRENILKAKLEILDGMDKDTPLILNGDDSLLYNAKVKEHPIYYYGIDNKFCRFKAYDIESDEESSSFIIDFGCGEQRVFLPAIGRHNIYNALAAFAAGFLLGIEPEQAADALADYVPAGMRQRVRNEKGIVFIEDCYNASPDSMRATLSALMQIKAKRHIAVLGDMLELGKVSNQAHSDVGALAAEMGVDTLFTYGSKAKLSSQAAVSAGIKVALSFEDKLQLSKELSSMLSPGDAVVFKASRGMRLEDVIKSVYKELGIGE